MGIGRTAAASSSVAFAVALLVACGSFADAGTGNGGGDGGNAGGEAGVSDVRAADVPAADGAFVRPVDVGDCTRNDCASGVDAFCADDDCAGVDWERTGSVVDTNGECRVLTVAGASGFIARSRPSVDVRRYLDLQLVLDPIQSTARTVVAQVSALGKTVDIVLVGEKLSICEGGGPGARCSPESLQRLDARHRVRLFGELSDDAPHGGLVLQIDCADAAVLPLGSPLTGQLSLKVGCVETTTAPCELVFDSVMFSVIPR